MPVEWAIAQGNARRMDRFTARCRVPVDVIHGRPRWAGAYVVYRSEEKAFVCRASVVVDEELREPRRPLDFDAMVELGSKHFSLLSKRLTHLPGNPEAAVSGLYWIPRESIRKAGGVTLEISTEQPSVPYKIEELLGDLSYKQLVTETLQHHVAVCKSATVHLPLPESIRGEATSSLLARVVSVYPAEDFVRLTPNTRITITVAPPAAGPEDVAMEEQEDEEVAMDRIGGLEKELQALREMILLPIQNQHLREQYDIEFPKGLLLCGPPGVGKTLLVRTAVEECKSQVPLHLEVINGSEIMTGGIGDAELALRNIFRKAALRATETDGASVIFIDELDALCPKRDTHGTMAHSRIVAQLLTLLDGADKQARANVVIVGATNLPNNIDPALRRPGRFDREVFVSPPDVAARKHIFRVHMQNMPYQVDKLPADQDAFIEQLAKRAIGYVGADIASLCREALSVASTRQFVELTRDQETKAWWDEWKRHGKAIEVSDLEKMVAGVAWRVNPVAIPVWFLSKGTQPKVQKPTDRPAEYFRYLFQGIQQSVGEVTTPQMAEEPSEPRVFEVTMADFEQATQVVVASAIRSAAGAAKNTEQLGWDSIGGQEETKLALQQALEWPIKYPQTFERLGVSPPRGILLYGPPGCSKSTIVRAAAHSSGATFLSLSAAQVFSPFFGDAEASVRQVFRDARAALPAIIFFDEIDVLVAKREFDGASSGSGSGSGSTAMRVLSTMLNEMDGVESAEGLLVIGATNRPDCIDAALLRPGRFDRILFVDLPTERDRYAILQIHTKRMTLHEDVDLVQIAQDTSFFSGAELENVCREAALRALRESIHAECVCMRHFIEAVASIRPASSNESLEMFFEFAARMGGMS
ncbi:hypothetical protein Poli38472_005529 [Pythium oligandrum]|uniref:AAA+ ATPase domain-containing protein n=1 Tax=Pythium oligandrum TaxID=41045 RepID=A0A8K1FHM9_PYTOL|nr:hypothetical protein Poli38472_005529 [Pythium oligandrum]|eukprot:TMW62911.1 hypothetical protein Poli38472_005529 [Pythium oligandrum]